MGFYPRASCARVTPFTHRIKLVSKSSTETLNITFSVGDPVATYYLHDIHFYSPPPTEIFLEYILSYVIHPSLPLLNPYINVSIIHLSLSRNIFLGKEIFITTLSSLD